MVESLTTITIIGHFSGLKHLESLPAAKKDFGDWEYFGQEGIAPPTGEEEKWTFIHFR
jgi:hypothetical protein